jgi:hypothetical protein
MKYEFVPSFVLIVRKASEQTSGYAKVLLGNHPERISKRVEYLTSSSTTGRQIEINGFHAGDASLRAGAEKRDKMVVK